MSPNRLIKKLDETNNLVFSSLATTISNDILAIIKLSMDGLDYQAMNILRNLYEIGSFLQYLTKLFHYKTQKILFHLSYSI